MKLSLAIALFVLACVLARAGEKHPAVGAADRPLIVATIPPIAMLLREVAGPEIEVRCLLPPGASPHTYEPRPSDMRAVTRCRALFTAGPGLDDWAERLPAPKIIRCVDIIPRERLMTFDDQAHDAEEDHGHTHDKGTIDPHFWTDPETAMEAGLAMSKSLTKLFPETDPKSFAKGAGGLVGRHSDLFLKINDELAPFNGRAVILFHPSFNYLLTRFGIRVAGVIEPAPGKEPSPKQIRELRDIIRREKITTVFTEPQLNPGPARALAEAAGVRLAELDPNGGVPGRETYEELILYNVKVLAKSFK